MPNPFWIRAVVYLAVGFAVITIAARGLTIDVTTLAIVASEVSAIAIALALFDRYLWRFRPFHWIPWPDRPPILRGTWQMRYTIEKGNPSKPRVAGEGDCFLTISQTSSQIRVQTLFRDGQSKSTNAAIVYDQDQHFLWFFYDFQPQSKLGRIGGAKLQLLRSPTELNGTYWNEIGEHGRLKSRGQSTREHTTFDRADADRYTVGS